MVHIPPVFSLLYYMKVDFRVLFLNTTAPYCSYPSNSIHLFLSIWPNTLQNPLDRDLTRIAPSFLPFPFKIMANPYRQ